MVGPIPVLLHWAAEVRPDERLSPRVPYGDEHDEVRRDPKQSPGGEPEVELQDRGLGEERSHAVRERSADGTDLRIKES